MEEMVRRLMSLESAVTEANKFAEAERVRCEQSEAVTESLLASTHRHDQLLAYHGKVSSVLCHNTTIQCVPPCVAGMLMCRSSPCVPRSRCWKTV